MKRIFFLLILSFSQFVLAEGTSVSGKFESRESDNQNFVKQQLLKDAFDNLISVEMKKINMNPEQFWQKYNQAFGEHLAPMKLKLEKKYGLDGDKKIDPVEQKKFEDELRLLSLEEKENFGGIRKVIQSYSITRTSRSPQMPELRYIDIEAVVDRRLLSELYLNFIRENKSTEAKVLYLTTKLELDNSAWTDLGVSAEPDLISVLNDSWKTWLGSQFKTFVSEVIITEAVKEQELSSLLRGAQGASSEATNPGGGLWLRISLVLKKVNEDNLVQTRDFKVSGDYNLVDISSGALLQSQDLNLQNTQFSSALDAKLSSAVASFLYNYPLPKLETASKELFAGTGGTKLTELSIQNVGSMVEVIELIDLLGQKGMVKHFQPTLKSMNNKLAIVELSYQGTFEEAAQIVKGLNLHKLTNSKQINVNQAENKFQISIR